MKPVFPLLICFLFSASVSHAQLTSGLIAHWNFNGNANDATGNGHNGTVVNATPAAGKAGIPNTAYSFNGTNSKITVPYQSDLNLSTFSICAVVKLNGFNTAPCQGNKILERGTEGGPGNYMLQLTDNRIDSSCVVTGDTSQFRFDLLRTGASTYQYPWTAGPIVHTGSWHCVVGTYNDTVFKLYVDGSLQATIVPYSKGAPGTSIQGICIGASGFGNNAQYPYWLKGLVDDLRLYNRALSAVEVSQYCNPLIDDTTTHDTTAYILPLIQDVQLTVYPNPTNGNFTIAGTMPGGNATISVYNAVGQLVHTEKMTAVNSKVEHSVILNGKLPDGMYLVNINTEGASNAYRIIVRQN